MENAWNWDLVKKNRNIYIGWTLSYWCNNKCNYCFQEKHVRYQKVSDGNQLPRFNLKHPRSSLKNLYRSFFKSSSAHAFDNATPEQWVNVFQKLGLGRKISLGITGGEPMLDHQNMLPFLNELLNLDCIEVVRVETNGQWNTDWYKELKRREKLHLNVSFHPTMINLSKFVENITKLRSASFNVAMVNFVVEPGQVDHFPALLDAMSTFDIYVDPAIYYQKRSLMPSDILELVSKHLPLNDLEMKTGKSTRGKLCNFPRLGASLAPDGTFIVPCNENTSLKNVFKAKREELDELFSLQSHPCPHSNCFCLHMYSFLEGNKRNLNSLNPLKEFVDEARRAI